MQSRLIATGASRIEGQRNEMSDLTDLFAPYSRAIKARDAELAAKAAGEDRFLSAAKLGEQLASGLPGFNAARDSQLNAVDAHSGIAHHFINGFAGMPIKRVNPAAEGPEAVAAFKAGQAKRRELGV